MKKLVHVLACFIVTASSVALAQDVTRESLKKDLYSAFDGADAIIVNCSSQVTATAKKLKAVYFECFKYSNGFDLFRGQWELKLSDFDVIQPWKEVGKTYTRIYKKGSFCIQMAVSNSTGSVIVTSKAP
jgi:hypothetical protein